MEELERVKNLLGELGFGIEKISEGEIHINSPKFGTVLIKICNSKPDIKKLDSKIVVISPYAARRINKDFLEKILNSEEGFVFVNKNSLEKIYPSTFFKVVNYLKENPNSYINKIANDLKIHPERVRRILMKLSDYVEVKSFEGKSLPKLPKLITLKNEPTEEKLKEIVGKKIVLTPKSKGRKKIKYQKITEEEAMLMILKFLEENPGTHLREISRKLKINPAIVHSCLKEISEFIEVSSPIGSEELNLPNLPNSIRIKSGYTADGILRFLKIKKMLKE